MNKKLLWPSIAVFFILFSSLLSAQVVRVLDLSTGQPIEHVFIVNKSASNATTTDASGIADVSAFADSEQITLTHASFVDTSITRPGRLEDALTIYLEPKVFTMPTFTLRSAREQLIEVPGQMTVLDAVEARILRPRTAADLLERSGEVFVQKSQVGGGSPVLRGFEANRILLMVDGVRLNNAIYRSGHLQNAISVDPLYLEKTEVLFGPGSLIYGSDALGGVIHFHTKRPEIGADTAFTIDAGYRSASATEETATHFDVAVSGQRLAWSGSFSKTSFGNVRMGKNRQHGDETWGLIPEYVETIGTEDLIRINPDPSVDVNSGYSQYDLAQKVLWAASDSMIIMFNTQYSTTSDVPRSDQLTAYRNGELRFAEWSYGPQERFLGSVVVDIIGDGEVHDKASFNIAYQRIGEDRINRRRGSLQRFTREETVDVFSMNADLVKQMINKDLYYGVEVTDNTVNSDASLTIITSGESILGPSRYPDGGSKMNTMAAYADLKFRPSVKVDFDLGIRYSHAYLRSDYVDTTFYSLPFDEVTFDNGAFTGAAGVIWRPTDVWKLGVSTASGFRSPNVDDYGKVFERAGIVVIPTDDLGPEYTMNGEARVSRTSKSGVVAAELGAFYTYIFDAIVQRPSQLNGQDSLLYEGAMARVAVNENADEAEIMGASASLSITPWPKWRLKSTLTYTQGEVVGRDEPLAHIPPLYTRTDLRYTSECMTLGAYVLHNSEKKQADIGPGRTDNADQGIDGGFPSWTTFTIYSDFQIGDGLSAGLTLDNLTDIHYRPFASGVSAPGRNLIFSVRYSL